MHLVERRGSGARSRSRAAIHLAVLFAWVLSVEAQEVKLNGPLVRSTPRGIVGFAGSGDGQHAFVLGDLVTDDEFELFRVNLAGDPKPITLSGVLVPGGDVGGDAAATLPFDGVVALSPSGTRIVYAADQVQNGRIDLFSTKPQGGTTVRLSGPFVAGGNIALGWTERPFRITPDETRVVYLADQEQDDVIELFVAPIDGGQPSLRLSAPLPTGQGANVSDFELSPDAREVVYRARQTLNGFTELYVVPVDGSSAPVRLSGPPVSAGGVLDYAISRDSRFVVFQADLRGHDRIELFSAQLDGPPARILLSGILDPRGDVLRFSITPTGTEVVYLADPVDDHYRVFSTPIRSRSTPREITGPMGNQGDAEDFALAPSGGRFVYRADQILNGRLELFGGPLDGSTPPVRLNSVPVQGGDVSKIVGFGTSAERVLYLSDERIDEQLSLFSAPIRGDGPPLELSAALIANGDVDPNSTVISPDGRWAVYLADQELDGVAELFSVPVDGSAPSRKLNVPLGAHAEILPTALVSEPDFQITADSSQVLYLADQELDGQHELHAAPIDGSHSAHQVTHTAPGPVVGDVSGSVVFTPDGTRALYVADQEVDETFELFSVPTDGSEASVKLNPLLAPAADVESVQVSPDGTWAVYDARRVLGERELFSVPVDGSATAVKLNGPLAVGGQVGPPGEGPDFAAITSDSTRVIYWATQLSPSRADLFVAPIDGHSAAVRLNEPPLDGVRTLALQPHGDRVLYVAGNDLFSVPLDGSQPPVRLHAPLTGTHGVAVFTQSSLVFTPDGSRVLYLADPFQDQDFVLFSVPVDGSSGPAQLSDLAVTGEVGLDPHTGSLSSSVKTSNDGLRAVFAGSGFFSRAIDGSAPAIPLHPPLVAGQATGTFEVDPVLSIVVFSLESSDPQEPSRLYSVPDDGSAPPLELSRDLSNLPPAFVPLSLRFASGGTRVIYSAPQPPRDHLVEFGLRSVPVDGSAPAVWLNDPDSTAAALPNVTPDGTRVVFWSNERSQGTPTENVSVVPADGSLAAELLSVPLPAGRIVAGLFPDPSGQRVLYIANRAEFGVFELFSDPIDPQGRPAPRHR